MVTIFLIVLAILAYMGRSLVMLASVGGMTVAMWFARRNRLPKQIVILTIGALAGGLMAEGVHVVNHLLQDDTPDHTGFWTSAVLVSLINAAAMLPAMWADSHLRRRARRRLESTRTLGR